MPLLGLILTVVGCRAVWRSPVRTALATLLAFVVLVPDTMVLPGPGLGYLPLHRIVLLAFALRLARDASTGDLWRAELRPSRVHVAFAAHVVAVLATGLVLAPAGLPTQPAVVAFLGVLEQVLLFSVVLIACRMVDDPGAVTRVFAVLVAISVGIAAVEHITHVSWANWLLGGTSQGLDRRGGEVRVRAAAQFALAFAWITTMLLPLLVAHLGPARRWWWRSVPALAVATVVWSGSRSALPAVGAGLVVLVVASRFEKRFVVFTVVAGLAGVAALAGIPGVTRSYTSREAAGSDQTRIGRLGVVTEITADRPVRGLGMASVSSTLGFYGADASYLLAYVESGVVGLTTLSVLLVTALLCVGGGLRAPPGSDRRVAAACLAAMVLGVAGAAAFDLFSVPGSGLVFWAVCAFGVSVSDRTRSLDVVAAPPSPWRALLPVAGVVLGLFVAATAPRHAAVEYRFETIPVGADVYAGGDLAHYGTITATSACQHVRHIDLVPDVNVRCRVIDQSGGLGVLRVQAPDATASRDFAAALVTRLAAAHPGFRAVAVGPPVSGRPTAAATAPVWLGLAALLFAILLPPPPLPRDTVPGRRRSPAPISVPT